VARQSRRSFLTPANVAQMGEVASLDEGIWEIDSPRDRRSRMGDRIALQPGLQKPDHGGRRVGTQGACGREAELEKLGNRRIAFLTGQSSAVVGIQGGTAPTLRFTPVRCTESKIVHMFPSRLSNGERFATMGIPFVTGVRLQAWIAPGPLVHECGRHSLAAVSPRCMFYGRTLDVGVA
jgi:hypothetical protein